MRHPALGAQDRVGQPSARLIQLATIAAAAYSLYLPLIRLYGIAQQPVRGYSGPVSADATRVGAAAIGLACFLPLMFWLTLSATRRERRWSERWALLAVLGVIFACLPVVGGGWAGMLYEPSALALVLVPVPWNLGLFAGLVASEGVLVGVFGLPAYASYFVVGGICLGVPLAILVVAIRRARQLQWARQQLADEAVLRERSRINAELRAAFDDGLNEVVREALQAAHLAVSDPAASSAQLRALVEKSRATLADARRLARRYRDGSLRSELETTVALLEAAGIRAHVELPAGELAPAVDEELRQQLRRAVADLLEREACAEATAAIALQDGRLTVVVRERSGGAGRASMPT